MLIAFKLKLLLACAAGFAGPIAVAPLVSDMAVHGTATEPAIVRIAPGSAPAAAADLARFALYRG